MSAQSRTAEAAAFRNGQNNPDEAVSAPNPTDAVVSFEGVTKTYLRNAGRALLRQRLRSLFVGSPPERFYALKGITFSVPRGASLGVVGSNGAGKSTLLRIVTSIAAPDSGRVKVRGTIAALMELGAGFHMDLTGRENVLLNASLLGLTRKETFEQFDSILEFSGIADFIEEPLRTYSSGMILRLAFAVAARANPDILVIDEILSVGDQNFQRKCIDHIKGTKRAGKTLVCVSHAIAHLRELCDQAIWLEHGEIRMSGPAATVLDAYYAEGQLP